MKVGLMRMKRRSFLHSSAAFLGAGVLHPMLGHADYRGPLKGLYHCGSGAHPCGGVTGAPGHNAAQVILRDHRGPFG